MALIWLRRHKGAIAFALTLLVIALTLANAWKHQYVTAKQLSDQKDAIAAISSIVTMTILIVGSMFSYYRFFKGRTLSLRAELTLSVSVHQTPAHYRIHAISLTAKNVGSSTIWNPTPRITVEIHGPKGIEEKHDVTDWWEDPGYEKDLVAVIDAGETVSFFARERIPDEAWAVTYLATLRADQGDAWHVSKTVSGNECEQSLATGTRTPG